MKKIIILLICVLVGLLMAACQPEEEPDMSDNDFGALLNEKIEGTKVHLGDVNDFYYTYEWVGYNAEYQRYRFFVEDGKYKFYHEARKIEGDYGWASEKDITSQGTVELTEDEWAQFLGTIRTGELKKPKESLEDGDSGPWLYLYYQKRNKTERMEFSFTDDESRTAFGELCETLEKRDS